MKYEYENPELEIINIDEEDIIRTSNSETEDDEF